MMNLLFTGVIIVVNTKDYINNKLLNFTCDKCYHTKGCEHCPLSLNSYLCTIAQAFKYQTFNNIIDSVNDDIKEIEEVITNKYEK